MFALTVLARSSDSSSGPATIGAVLGVIVLVAIVFFSAKAAKARGAADLADKVLSTFVIPQVTVLRLTDTELIEGYGAAGRRHKLSGLVGQVEEGGSVNRRFAATRIVALGVLAAGLPKKVDDRELYLTIERPDTVIVHAIPVKKSKTMTADARRFVANPQSRRQALAVPDTRLRSADGVVAVRADRPCSCAHATDSPFEIRSVRAAAHALHASLDYERSGVEARSAHRTPRQRSHHRRRVRRQAGRTSFAFLAVHRRHAG